ncbi:helix-turn-helix domain-containing protein [Streptomyces sp. GbtcB7]|nr:helix-turn-helix domain-containing protein [Streptomyces sp. GbtcB7]
MRALTRLLGAAPPSVCRPVDRLKALGFVERRSALPRQPPRSHALLDPRSAVSAWPSSATNFSSRPVSHGE